MKVKREIDTNTEAKERRPSSASVAAELPVSSFFFSQINTFARDKNLLSLARTEKEKEKYLPFRRARSWPCFALLSSSLSRKLAILS